MAAMNMKINYHDTSSNGASGLDLFLLLGMYLFLLLAMYLIHSIIEEKMTFNSYYCQVGEGKLTLGEKLKEK